jgi:hypothetical protein
MGRIGLVCVALAACSFRGRLDASGDGPPPPDDASLDGTTDPDAPDAAPDAAVMQEIVVTIAASGDDALQDPGGASGPVLLTHPWTSLYTSDHWGALRFTIPQIANDAQIVEAYLDLFVDTGAQEDDPNVSITTEATSDPVALAAIDNDIGRRPRGTSIVTWVANDIGTGMLRRTPSLVTLVQERVSAPTWAAGKPILFIFDTLGPSFEFRQWDHTMGAFAAKLTVRFVNP